MKKELYKSLVLSYTNLQLRVKFEPNITQK